MIPNAARAADNAPVQEIEVTPEMMAAGFRVFAMSGVTDDPLEADKLLVEKIYLAMESCRIQAYRKSHL